MVSGMLKQQSEQSRMREQESLQQIQTQKD